MIVYFAIWFSFFLGDDVNLLSMHPRLQLLSRAKTNSFLNLIICYNQIGVFKSDISEVI